MKILMYIGGKTKRNSWSFTNRTSWCLQVKVALQDFPVTLKFKEPWGDFNPNSSRTLLYCLPKTHYKHMSPKQLMYVIAKNCKSSIVIDLCCAFLDMGRLCRTCMLVVKVYLKSFWSMKVFLTFNCTRAWRILPPSQYDCPCF